MKTTPSAERVGNYTPRMDSEDDDGGRGPFSNVSHELRRRDEELVVPHLELRTYRSERALPFLAE